MEDLNDIRNKIDEIRNSDFQLNVFWFQGKYNKYCDLFNKAVLCYYSICTLKNEDEYDELLKELDDVMKRKFRELNSNFSEDILNNMILSYRRSIDNTPLDIFVIDDAVLFKEECDFKVCIQKDGNISLYTLHQSFDNDKAIWTVVNVNNDVWSFNEAVSKSNSIDSPKKKIKD